MEKTMLKEIIEAAESKFGPVLAARIRNEKEGECKLAIMRDGKPTYPDHNYMTITGFRKASGEISFCWGHYDMTAEQIETFIKSDFRSC